MAHEISIAQVAQNEGFDTVDGLLKAATFDQLPGWGVPAVCSDGCEVEPDGVCEHGFPSVLLKAGLI